MRASFIACIVALFFVVAQATTIEKPLADPVQEAHARELFYALKCVVCEGQSLADSDAKLAIQMRAKIREMLEEGKTPDEVAAYFRASYGERIFMRPPVAENTLLLWFAPCLLLVIGGGLVWKVIRSGRKQDD